jgi:hypothetical protein
MKNIKEDFAQIFAFLESKEANKEIHFEMILKDSVAFFDKMKEIFQTGSEEDKKEMMGLMNGMYQSLLQKMQKLCEKSGMNQDQLFSYCDNPNNFAPDQWNLIQSAKNQLLRSGQGLSEQIIASQKQPGTTPAPTPVKTPRPPKIKKSEWLKS